MNLIGQQQIDRDGVSMKTLGELTTRKRSEKVFILQMGKNRNHGPHSLTKEDAKITRQTNSTHNASADAASGSTGSAHGPGLDRSEKEARKRRK